MSFQRTQQQLYGYKNVTITAVDTTTGIIDAIDINMQNYRALMGLYNNTLTAVPAVGEAWLIKKNSSNWELYARYEDPSMNTALADLQPGDQRIDATGTLYVSAQSIIFSDGSLDGAIDGTALAYPVNMWQDNINSNADLIITQGTADSYPTFSITERMSENDITLYFGGGGSVPDVALYRSGSNTLTLGGNLIVTGNIVQGSPSTSYTVANYSTQRSFDASTASLAGVANTLATLISDLKYMSLPAQAPSGGTVAIGTNWTINVPLPFGEFDMSSLPTVWHSS